MFDETSEEFVSNIRNHLIVGGTIGGFVANMQNNLEDHRTLNSFVRKAQNHLVIFETRECSASNCRGFLIKYTEVSNDLQNFGTFRIK